MQLQHIYDKLQDEYENAIMEKYGYTGRRITAVLISKIIFFNVCIRLQLFLLQKFTIFSRRVNPNVNKLILTKTIIYLYTYVQCIAPLKIYVLYVLRKENNNL